MRIGAGEHRRERLAGGVLAVPVALRHARPAHPDLADSARRQGFAGLRIDDSHVLAVEFAARAHEPAGPGREARAGGRRTRLERRRVERPDHGRLELHAARHHQRAFGEPVAGEERFAPEAAHGERLGEGVDRLGPHRLRAVEGQRPAGEIEARPLFGRRLPHAQLVGEVRPAADRGPILRDRLQPPQRLLQEGHGRHEHVELAAVERHEDAPDEPHVVEARQPEHARLAARDLEGLHDPQRVVEQILVRQHHALGRAGGAARVLEEGERVAADVGAAPAVCPVEFELGIDLPKQLLEARRRGPQGVEPVEHVARRERDRRPGIGRDRLDPLHGAILPRRIGRHGDRPAVETAHEGRDEVEPGGIEQQHPLPLHPRRHQPRPERPGLPVELGIRDVQLLVFAVDEERERPVVGAIRGPLPQEIDDRLRERAFGVGIGNHVVGSLHPPPAALRQPKPATSCNSADSRPGPAF